MAIKSDSYLASLFGLEGKTIVVTGAGGGIGLAISEGLLRAGAEVALCNRTTAKCTPLADRIIAEGGTAWFTSWTSPAWTASTPVWMRS